MKFKKRKNNFFLVFVSFLMVFALVGCVIINIEFNSPSEDSSNNSPSSDSSSESVGALYLEYSTDFTDDFAREALRVYIPSGERYINYNIVHTVSTGLNSDVWRLGPAYSFDKTFSTSIPLTVEGAEWDMAIRVSGASDFTGGRAHGDELMESINFYVDGESVDITTFKKKTEFSKLRIVETSTGYNPDEQATAVFTHQKEFVIDKSDVVLDQNVEFLIDTGISQSYLAMMPPLKTLTDKYYTNLDVTVKDIDSSVDLQIPNCKSATFFGDEYSFTMAISKYPKMTTGATFLGTDNNNGSYNKMYYIISSTSVKAGDVWQSTTHYNINYLK